MRREMGRLRQEQDNLEPDPQYLSVGQVGVVRKRPGSGRSRRTRSRTYLSLRQVGVLKTWTHWTGFGMRRRTRGRNF